MLVVATWLWGAKYSPIYVDRLFASVRRNLKQPFRFMVMCERDREAVFMPGIERHAIKDPQLIDVKGCFARLRMFDPGWQHNRQIDDRLVCIDLDVVITGSLDSLFDRPGDFTILQGVNSSNPCPFNGSVFMLRAGAHADVFTDFSLEVVNTLPYDSFPDDQGWFAHKIPHAAAWTPAADGVYAFGKPGWPKGDALPKNARIVSFPGWRDPSKFATVPWVLANWRT